MNHRHFPMIPPRYIVLFRGDDSDFVGNQSIYLTIDTEIPLEGCKAHFRFLDFAIDFDEIPEDGKLLLVFPKDKTAKFPLGAMDATLELEDSLGRKRTVSNRIHIVVTNSIHEAYCSEDPQAITVIMSGDEFLKDAEVSEDHKTLTIKKSDGTEISFRGGGGGGGTSDYNDLENKPSIDGFTLQGDLESEMMGLAKTDYVNGQIAGLGETEAQHYNEFISHIDNKDNPHEVTAAQVGTYTTAEIDDKITRFVAHYLTAKNAEGRFVPFATHAALAYAKTHHTDENPQFFYAGQGFTPTKNDYCVVLSDETYSGKTTRYSFVGDWPTGQFQYQYTINDTAFSQAQWDAINSGVTAEKLADIASDLAELDEKTENLGEGINNLEGSVEDIQNMINNIEGDVGSIRNGLGELGEEVDKKAYKLDNTVVDKIDEEQHDDNIMVRVMRVPIEFARKNFNAVRVSFHQNDEDQYVYMGIGYSTGDGGSSGLMYTDILVEYSPNGFYKNDSGIHTYRFSQNVTSQIPSDAKFLTFFFYHDAVEELEGTAPIETGYATTEEEAQKKYQIQQNAGFFFVDHAPLMDFLVVDDPVARKSSVDSIENQTKSAIGFSQYPIKAVVNGQLLDRTVNTSTGGAFTFPASGTGARDFVVVVAASSTAPSVSFPSTGFTYFSDDDSVWTAEADKMNIWYFTEIAANQFMVAHKALSQTTQA